MKFRLEKLFDLSGF